MTVKIETGKCEQCGKPLDIKDYFLGSGVCYACVVKNHKEVTGQ